MVLGRQGSVSGGLKANAPLTMSVRPLPFSTSWLVSLSHATRVDSDRLQAALSLGRRILARGIELTRTRLVINAQVFGSQEFKLARPS